MDEFVIDDISIEENEVADKSDIQLPVNFISIGTIDEDDVKVYIKKSVFQAVEDYSASDISHELGSILLGNYEEVTGRTSIVISDYIEAKYTDTSASTLTFTHETWDYVHKIKDENYSGKSIVGWQHTHPGYGVFLSYYDMFIQKNFFNLPFQTAYVVDPKQKLRGFFQWKNGKVEKLKGFYIYDEVGEKIEIEIPTANTVEEHGDSSTEIGNDKKSKGTVILFIAVAFLTMIITFALAVLLFAGKIR